MKKLETARCSDTHTHMKKRMLGSFYIICYSRIISWYLFVIRCFASLCFVIGCFASLLPIFQFLHELFGKKNFVWKTCRIWDFVFFVGRLQPPKNSLLLFLVVVTDHDDGEQRAIDSNGDDDSKTHHLLKKEEESKEKKDDDRASQTISNATISTSNAATSSTAVPKEMMILLWTLQRRFWLRMTIPTMVFFATNWIRMGLTRRFAAGKWQRL